MNALPYKFKKTIGANISVLQNVPHFVSWILGHNKDFLNFVSSVKFAMKVSIEYLPVFRANVKSLRTFAAFFEGESQMRAAGKRVGEINNSTRI